MMRHRSEDDRPHERMDVVTPPNPQHVETQTAPDHKQRLELSSAGDEGQVRRGAEATCQSSEALQPAKAKRSPTSAPTRVYHRESEQSTRAANAEGRSYLCNGETRPMPAKVWERERRRADQQNRTPTRGSPGTPGRGLRTACKATTQVRGDGLLGELVCELLEGPKSTETCPAAGHSGGTEEGGRDVASCGHGGLTQVSVPHGSPEGPACGC